MLQEVFYWIFNMSITAVIIGLVVMLVRRIRRIPRRVTVFLWLAPFLRMIIPVGLNSPYSFMSLFSRFATKTVIVYRPMERVEFSMMNSVMAADSYFPITYKVDILKDVFSIASIIWVVVFLIILLMLVISYVSAWYGIKDAVKLQGDLYYSDRILTPAVYGVIRPRIVLPESCRDKEISYILLHEKMHIRRLDNLWRILAFAAAAVHWFNPFSWVFLKMFLADLELSCDECVLVKLGGTQVKEYARSLLESKESTNVFVSAFGGAKLRSRIENILSFKKMTWLSLLGFLVLLTEILYFLLTNAG